MKKILVINPGSTSTKIAFYHDGEQVWKESIEHDAAEIKKYTVIYDQKEMRTALVLQALADHGEKISELSGVVARGGLLPSYTDPETGAVTTVASGAYEVTPALIEALRDRPVNHHASNLGCAIAYGIMGYNKGLEGRTTHDWLNRDAAEVDKYLADERCTFTFTLNAYYSMFSGILRLHDPAFLARMPKDLPLLFLAGTADPVGDRGKGVLRAIQSLKAAGVQNIRCKLYPGARHELLVETNRQEVFADIAAWLNDQLR